MTPADQHPNTSLPVTFALVRPSEPGNAGAAARTLTAFGFRELLLIAPHRRPGAEDQAFARWGGETLARARILDEDEATRSLARFAEIWGTTARAGRNRKLEPPDELVAGYLERGAGPLLVLFGPERDGLSRDWLDRCHRLARIPAPGGPLNLAHAVTVIAYELRRQMEARAAGGRGPGRSRRGAVSDRDAVSRQASPAQRREILARSSLLLAALGYPTRSLKRHPPEAYLEPLRSGRFTSRQAEWMLGLLARLEQRLAGAVAEPPRRDGTAEPGAKKRRAAAQGRAEPRGPGAQAGKSGSPRKSKR